MGRPYASHPWFSTEQLCISVSFFFFFLVCLGSVVATHWSLVALQHLSCDQGSNPRLLHCKADS